MFQRIQTSFLENLISLFSDVSQGPPGSPGRDGIAGQPGEKGENVCISFLRGFLSTELKYHRSSKLIRETLGKFTYFTFSDFRENQVNSASQERLDLR